MILSIEKLIAQTEKSLFSFGQNVASLGDSILRKNHLLSHIKAFNPPPPPPEFCRPEYS
jgi:hypothetical protein